MSNELTRMLKAIDAQKRIEAKAKIVSEEEHLPVRDQPQDAKVKPTQSDERGQSE